MLRLAELADTGDEPSGVTPSRKVTLPVAGKAEVNTNMTELPIKKNLRPYISDNLPEIGTTAVLVSKYAVVTHA